MRFRIRLVTLLVLTAATAAIADDKPAAKKDDKPAAKKYADVSQMTGKLDKFEAGKSELTIEYQSGIGRYARKERTDYTLADEVKVWFKTPPEKIDADGNTKKMTPAELDKIKSKSGPTKGLYAGETSGLHAGQQVQIVISRLKDAPKPKAGEKEFLYVTQVMVLADDHPPGKTEKKK
jgi:hypothetical protein